MPRSGDEINRATLAEVQRRLLGRVTPTYEGYVKFADGSIWSIQCFEGRHEECPEDPGTLPGPLDGYFCECGCKVHEERMA